MGCFNIAEAARHIEFAPAIGAIADLPDNTGLGAPNDAGVCIRFFPHGAHFIAHDGRPLVRQQIGLHPALCAIGIFNLAPIGVSREHLHGEARALIHPAGGELLPGACAHPRLTGVDRAPIRHLFLGGDCRRGNHQSGHNQDATKTHNPKLLPRRLHSLPQLLARFNSACSRMFRSLAIGA
mgnify:CR=1 FL=1